MPRTVPAASTQLSTPDAGSPSHVASVETRDDEDAENFQEFSVLHPAVASKQTHPNRFELR